MEKQKLNTFKDILDNNKELQEIIEVLLSKGIKHVSLTGGAVTDIMDGKTPKDYDFTDYGVHNTIIESDHDIVFVRRTKSADTYLVKGKYEVQFLKRHPEDFKFTIEQVTYQINSKTLGNFCVESYLTRRLIVNMKPFDGKSVYYKDFKARIKHWRRKGYTIDKTSYKSFKKACIRRGFLCNIFSSKNFSS